MRSSLGRIVLVMLTLATGSPALADSHGCGLSIARCLPLAEQGDAEAQYELGLIYLNGDDVPQDYAEALRWFVLAAQQGHAWSQWNLGLMYANGRGVPQDYAEAVRWYRLSAEQGDAWSQVYLGDMYANGQDYVHAHMWYNLAATLDWLGARRATASRDAVEDRMTPQQIAEAQKLARDWFAAHSTP
jgi:TPR repeat protein